MLVPIRLDNKPENIVGHLRWLVEGRWDDVCIIMVEREAEYQLTYGDLFAHAEAFKGSLEKAGIRSGDLCVLVLEHGESVIFGFWGALLGGAIPSIFPFLSEKQDPTRYLSTVRELVEHSGVKAIITSGQFEAALCNTLPASVTVITVEDLTPESHAGLPTYDETKDILALAAAGLRATDTVFLQHSSGSTGLQKGVMLSHRAVINQVASYSDAIGLTRRDVVVSWLPLYHDMGLIAGFIMPILQGVKLVLMSPFHWIQNPRMLMDAIERYNGTLTWLPNFAYNLLASRIRDVCSLDLSSMRAFINCSEPVYEESHDGFMKKYEESRLHPHALATCYAMAENTFAVTQSVLDSPLTLDVVNRRRLTEEKLALPWNGDGPRTTFVSCGKPIANCEIRIVDEARRPLPDRHVGEVSLRSDSMLSGYYRRDDAPLADGWFYTGDMGYIAMGELFITGRMKDLIIVFGKNVFPQDIEYLLNDIPGLHPGRAAVFGLFNPELGTEEIAIVAEADVDDAGERAEIGTTIRARISQQTEVTARYVTLVHKGWLIKTTSGKVARRANKEKYLREFRCDQPPG